MICICHSDMRKKRNSRQSLLPLKRLIAVSFIVMTIPFEQVSGNGRTVAVLIDISTQASESLSLSIFVHRMFTSAARRAACFFSCFSCFIISCSHVFYNFFSLYSTLFVLSDCTKNSPPRLRDGLLVSLA